MKHHLYNNFEQNGAEVLRSLVKSWKREPWCQKQMKTVNFEVKKDPTRLISIVSKPIKVVVVVVVVFVKKNEVQNFLIQKQYMSKKVLDPK